jgi:hypothetical protein
MKLHEYFPRHESEKTLLAKLEELGFDFTESPHSHANRADAVYLGKPVLTPAEVDEDGNETAPPVISELYCANVVSQTPLNFGDIDTTEPNNPVSRFAL